MIKSDQKKALFVLFLIVVTELIGFGLIIPVLPQLAKQFEANHLLIGILMASYSFAQFFAAPILGHLSDKYGRKPILVISKIGTVCAYMLLAVSNTYALFLISRLIDGFTGGNISIARAYVADITDEDDRPKGMAIIGIAFGLGFVLGPALGGMLYHSGHYLPAVVAGSLSLIATILTIILLKEPEKHTESKASSESLLSGFTYLKQKAILTICVTYLGYMIVFSGFETTFSLFTESIFQFTPKDNSWLFMYAGILTLFIQGYLSRKASTKQRYMISIGFIFATLSFFGYAAVSQISILLAWLAVMAIGIGLINTYLPALLSTYTTPHNRGAIMGLYEGIGSLSRIIGPLFAYAFVIDLPRTGYFGFAIILILTFLYLNLFLPKHKK